LHTLFEQGVIAALPVLKSMSTCDIAPRTATSLGTSYPRGAAGAGNRLAKVVQLNNRENEVQDAEDDLMGLQKPS